MWELSVPWYLTLKYVSVSQVWLWISWDSDPVQDKEVTKDEWMKECLIELINAYLTSCFWCIFPLFSEIYLVCYANLDVIELLICSSTFCGYKRTPEIFYQTHTYPGKSLFFWALYLWSSDPHWLWWKGNHRFFSVLQIYDYVFGVDVTMVNLCIVIDVNILLCRHFWVWNNIGYGLKIVGRSPCGQIFP